MGSIDVATISFVRGGFDSLPELCQPAAVLHFGNVLHYAEDPIQALSELIPALVLGGMIIVVEPFTFGAARLTPGSPGFDAAYHEAKLSKTRATFAAVRELLLGHTDFECVYLEETANQGIVIARRFA